jgi:hypothetical protein
MPLLTKHTWRANGPRRKDPQAPTKADAKRGASEDGQALVEFALVLPIVLVILFGIVLFGVALNDWINETQLTSEAARYAEVNQTCGLKVKIEKGVETIEGTPKSCEGGAPDEEKFLKWLVQQGDNSDVRNATATMCSPHSKEGEPVEVKLEYKYNWFGLANLLGAKAETPLVSRATLRIETPPTTPYLTSC